MLSIFKDLGVNCQERNVMAGDWMGNDPAACNIEFQEYSIRLLLVCSAVCITMRSQNAHRGVKIETFTSLWVPLKGQSGEILLGVNNSIM